MTDALVSFVGAGPGAEDLVTLRALRRVRESDVVIHDRLVPPSLLAAAPEDAEVIDVGKAPGQPCATQDDINRLLIARARTARRVVRLKGGDPAVFGRLAEEIRAVRAAGLRFEIVPGVTAATAAAAVAGVSLTERGHASTVVLATGTDGRGDGTAALEWGSLARLGGTLVLYMALHRVDDIATTLIALGRDPGEPAAVVACIGAHEECVVTAPLCELAAAVRDAHVPSPATLLIGATLAAATEAGTRSRVGACA